MGRSRVAVWGRLWRQFEAGQGGRLSLVFGSLVTLGKVSSLVQEERQKRECYSS